MTDFFFVHFQNKTCVQTLEGHAQNISCVGFHPELPIILTGSEDGMFSFIYTHVTILFLLRVGKMMDGYC